MYFGNTKSSSEPIILQLTGQLTLQTPHPTCLKNLHQYIPENLPCSYEHMKHSQYESHSLGVRQPLLREQLRQPSKYLPLFQVNHVSQQNQQKNTKQNDRQSQEQNRKKRNERQTLEGRIEQLEQMLEKSIKRVNLQTLETFDNLREELLDQITVYDQEYRQRVRNLEKIEKQWDQKSDKLLERQEKKLNNKKRELERVVNKKVEYILKEERRETQNRMKGHIQKLHQYFEEQKTQTEEWLEEINKNNEMLEEQLQLKVQEQVKSSIFSRLLYLFYFQEYATKITLNFPKSLEKIDNDGICSHINQKHILIKQFLL